jgi:hypothetical protein
LRVPAESIDVLCLVRAEAPQRLFVNPMAFRHQQLQCFRHGRDVVEDEQIRDQMMVLDHLPLLVPRVFGQHPYRYPMRAVAVCHRRRWGQ